MALSSLLFLNLALLTWRIWWAPNNASRWLLGFNSVFEGLNHLLLLSSSNLLTTIGSYPRGFQLVTFLTNYVSSILLRCGHHFNLCIFVYLLISLPFIHICSILLLLILHLSLHWTGPNIVLEMWISKINKLFIFRTNSARFHMRRSLSALSVSCRSSFYYIC